jgi:virulence-associated protein VagC
MKVKVTEQGITVPKEFFVGVEEVEIRRENGWIVMVPTQSSVNRRMLGLHPSSIQMSEDFDQPLPEDFWLGNNS